MNIEFVAEPIVSINEKLLGVELLTRFVLNMTKPLHPQFVISGWDFERKQSFLYQQIDVIASKRSWFERNGLFCTLNIDDDMAMLISIDEKLKNNLKSMPFVKLEVSEHFHEREPELKNPLLKSLNQGQNGLWLDDLGAGNANIACLLNGYFEVAKIDRYFFKEEIKKNTFLLLIKNIRKYCDKIVVEGIESRQHFPVLREANIWGLQGYLFESVPFHQIESLL
ncbi:EAL domain-containing protein [uncultured Cedecea sp.]|uniref:EAL domain-containing protein n=1 Tax=uncultured Cedecea sp. TaxID=988762 RepID=UPI002613E7EB|nr:EAL domain-containing protein [uncultured Cedecea sp.]